MSAPWSDRREIGLATLYLGSMEEVLPRLGRFGAAVTDPPYGIGADKMGAKGMGPGGKKFALKDWDGRRPPKPAFDLIRAKTEMQIIWGGNYFADFLPATMRWLVWDKMIREFSMASVELAWTSEQKAARAFSLATAAADRAEPRVHPTQKPVALMKWCLAFVPAGWSILDPYMGSGTTGVAAVQAGRRFVGVERDPEFFEAACARIAAGQRQGDFFVAPDAAGEAGHAQ